MQQHGRTYFVYRPPSTPLPDPGVGSKGQKFIFSEHDPVAYQIKGNHDCRNMVADILPADPYPTLKIKR